MVARRGRRALRGLRADRDGGKRHPLRRAVQGSTFPPDRKSEMGKGAVVKRGGFC